MSSDSIPYAFNPLDGKEEDAIRHLKAIRQIYEKIHGKMSHGEGFQSPIEILVNAYRRFDGRPRDDGRIMPDLGGTRYAHLTHNDKQQLTISFSSTTPDESKVQHVDPDSYVDESGSRLRSVS